MTVRESSPISDKYAVCIVCQRIFGVAKLDATDNRLKNALITRGMQTSNEAE